MKTRIYLRIGKAKNRTVVRCSSVPCYESVNTGGYLQVSLPTVMVALDLDIPDKEFDAARILLETKIQNAVPACEIKQVSQNSEVKK